MNVIDIFLIILILSASTFFIFAIIYLKKLVQHVEAVRKDVNELVQNANPILQNINSVVRKANRVVSEVENYWDELDSSIKNLRERISNFTPLKVFSESNNPVSELIKNVRAVTKGIVTFWQAFKRK
jgi:uncharacterized protein YoxC